MVRGLGICGLSPGLSQPAWNLGHIWGVLADLTSHPTAPAHLDPQGPGAALWGSPKMGCGH